MTTASRSGERLGHYELLEVIASTSSCERYLATDHATRCAVEINVPTERGVSSPGVVERLVRHANLARGLEHPALARLIALEADGQGVPFVVEEHVRGELLSQHLTASPHGLPLEVVLHTLTPIVEALVACHQVGLVHGCIDSDHVMMTAAAGGTLAKLIRGGVAIDSQASRLAPELRTPGYGADPRSDVWAVAALLYELLCGAPPESATAHAPSIPQELAAVLRQCLLVAPERRPRDAVALRDVMLRVRDQVGSSPVHASSPQTAATAAAKRTLVEFAAPRRTRRRRRALMVDPATGLMVERSMSRRFRAPTMVGHAGNHADHDAQAEPVDTEPPASDPHADLAVNTEPVTLPQPPDVTVDVPAPEAPSYQLPARTFWDLKPKTGRDALATEPQPTPAALEPAAVAPGALAGAQEPAAASLRAATGPEPQPGVVALQPVLREQLAVTPRAAAARTVEPNSQTSHASPNGPRRARSMRAKPRAAVAKARKAKPKSAAPRSSHSVRAARRSLPARQAFRSAQAARKGVPRTQAPAAQTDASRDLRAFRSREGRARFGDETASATAAIRRAGEHEARSWLRAELLTLILCTLVFFGVPLLCDPARAQQLLGARLRPGAALLAASAVVALMQVWWLQMTTRRAALWPASAALKALTLLVCFLAATHFVPPGMFGSLEAAARSALPWTAGAFYLCFGLYGLSRARYNTAQHALLGTTLTLLYAGSALGSYRVFNTASVAQQHAASRDAVAATLQALARRKSATPRLGLPDDRSVEAELEAQGDTTGETTADSPHTSDGSENSDLHTVERLKASRNQRAANLEALHKQLQSLAHPNAGETPEP